MTNPHLKHLINEVKLQIKNNPSFSEEELKLEQTKVFLGQLDITLANSTVEDKLKLAASCAVDFVYELASRELTEDSIKEKSTIIFKKSRFN